MFEQMSRSVAGSVDLQDHGSRREGDLRKQGSINITELRPPWLQIAFGEPSGHQTYVAEAQNKGLGTGRMLWILEDLCRCFPELLAVRLPGDGPDALFERDSLGLDPPSWGRIFQTLHDM